MDLVRIGVSISQKPCSSKILADRERNAVAKADIAPATAAGADRDSDTAAARLRRPAIVFRDLKRRRLRFVEQPELARQHFDLAGGEFGIDRLRRAAFDEPAHADHKLRPKPLGLRQQLLVVADDDLRDAFAIADIDEEHAAEIAHAVHPAEERRVGAEIVGAQRAAGVSSFPVAELFCHLVSRCTDDGRGINAMRICGLRA